MTQSNVLAFSFQQKKIRSFYNVERLKVVFLFFCSLTLLAYSIFLVLFFVFCFHCFHRHHHHFHRLLLHILVIKITKIILYFAFSGWCVCILIKCVVKIVYQKKKQTLQLMFISQKNNNSYQLLAFDRYLRT